MRPSAFPHPPSSEAPTKPSECDAEQAQRRSAATPAEVRSSRRLRKTNEGTAHLCSGTFHTRIGLGMVGGGGWLGRRFFSGNAATKSADGGMARQLRGGSQTSEDVTPFMGQSKPVGKPRMSKSHIFATAKTPVMQFTWVLTEGKP